MSSSPRRVLLDVDTGIDDALALLYAATSPRIDLVGVSAVLGNVPVEVAARNSRSVLAAAAHPHTPVVTGAAFTTDGRGPREGSTNHGVDGLGGVPIVPPDEETITKRDPVAVLNALAAAAPLTVAACAPLTNVARYASRPGVEQIVLVGGELTTEDPDPEFNVGHDPLAAASVLAAGRPTTVYAIDVFETIAASEADVDRLRGAATPAARLAGELLAVRRAHLLGDAGALVLLTHPELFTLERRRMAVIGDRLVPDEQAVPSHLVDVVIAADTAAVVEAYLATLLGSRA